MDFEINSFGGGPPPTNPDITYQVKGFTFLLYGLLMLFYHEKYKNTLNTCNLFRTSFPTYRHSNFMLRYKLTQDVLYAKRT